MPPETPAPPPSGNCPGGRPDTTCSGPQWTMPWKLLGSTCGKFAPRVIGVPVFAKPVAAGGRFPASGTK